MTTEWIGSIPWNRTEKKDANGPQAEQRILHGNDGLDLHRKLVSMTCSLDNSRIIEGESFCKPSLHLLDRIEKEGPTVNYSLPALYE